MELNLITLCPIANFCMSNICLVHKYHSYYHNRDIHFNIIIMIRFVPNIANVNICPIERKQMICLLDFNYGTMIWSTFKFEMV